MVLTAAVIVFGVVTLGTVLHTVTFASRDVAAQISESDTSPFNDTQDVVVMDAGPPNTPPEDTTASSGSDPVEEDTVKEDRNDKSGAKKNTQV